MGRILLFAGLALVCLGIIFIAAERVGIRFGQLPGDLVVRKKNFAFYFPLATCVLLSLLLTLAGWLFRR